MVPEGEVWLLPADPDDSAGRVTGPNVIVREEALRAIRKNMLFE